MLKKKRLIHANRDCCFFATLVHVSVFFAANQIIRLVVSPMKSMG